MDLYPPLNASSKAYVEGVELGDLVHNINGTDANTLTENQALRLIKQATNTLQVQLSRNPSYKPSSTTSNNHNHNHNHTATGSPLSPPSSSSTSPQQQQQWVYNHSNGNHSNGNHSNHNHHRHYHNHQPHHQRSINGRSYTNHHNHQRATTHNHLHTPLTNGLGNVGSSTTNTATSNSTASGGVSRAIYTTSALDHLHTDPYDESAGSSSDSNDSVVYSSNNNTVRRVRNNNNNNQQQRVNNNNSSVTSSSSSSGLVRPPTIGEADSSTTAITTTAHSHVSDTQKLADTSIVHTATTTTTSISHNNNSDSKMSTPSTLVWSPHGSPAPARACVTPGPERGYQTLPTRRSKGRVMFEEQHKASSFEEAIVPEHQHNKRTQGAHTVEELQKMSVMPNTWLQKPDEQKQPGDGHCASSSYNEPSYGQTSSPAQPPANHQYTPPQPKRSITPILKRTTPSQQPVTQPNVPQWLQNHVNQPPHQYQQKPQHHQLPSAATMIPQEPGRDYSAGKQQQQQQRPGQTKVQLQPTSPPVQRHHQPVYHHQQQPQQQHQAPLQQHQVQQQHRQRSETPTQQPRRSVTPVQQRRSVTPTQQRRSVTPTQQQQEKKYSHHIVQSPVLKHKVPFARRVPPEEDAKNKNKYSASQGIFLRKPSLSPPSTPTSSVPAAHSKGLAMFFSQLEKNTDPEDRKMLPSLDKKPEKPILKKYTPPPRRRAVTPPVGFVTQRPLCSPTPSEGSWEVNDNSAAAQPMASPLNMKAFTAPSPLISLQEKQPAPVAQPPTYTQQNDFPAAPAANVRTLSPINENIIQPSMNSTIKPSEPANESSNLTQSRVSFFDQKAQEHQQQQEQLEKHPQRSQTPSSFAHPTVEPTTTPGSPLTGRATHNKPATSYRPVTPSGKMSPATQRKYPPGFRSVTPILGRSSPVGSPAPVKKLIPSITVEEADKHQPFSSTLPAASSIGTSNGKFTDSGISSPSSTLSRTNKPVWSPSQQHSVEDSVSADTAPSSHHSAPGSGDPSLFPFTTGGSLGGVAGSGRSTTAPRGGGLAAAAGRGGEGVGGEGDPSEEDSTSRITSPHQLLTNYSDIEATRQKALQNQQRNNLITPESPVASSSSLLSSTTSPSNGQHDTASPLHQQTALSEPPMTADSMTDTSAPHVSVPPDVVSTADTSAAAKNDAAPWSSTLKSLNNGDNKSNLPPSQSPMITLLQKNREGQIPKGAIYMGTRETVDGDVKHLDTFYLLPEEKVTTTTVTEKKAPHYDDVGPVTKDGVPTALKTSVDDKKQKDWYKNIFKTLHQMPQSDDTNSYKPTYVFPESTPGDDEEVEVRPPSPEDRYSNIAAKAGSWSPPHARYTDERYKVQPRSISDYEPGRSSISSATKRTPASEIYNPPADIPENRNKYTVSKHLSEPDIRKKDRPEGTEIDAKEAYKVIQKGGEIPHTGLRQTCPEKKEPRYQVSTVPRTHRSTSDLPTSAIASATRSPASTLDRRQRDLEAQRRKQELQRITREEKRKKLEEEARQNDARKHSDHFLDDKYWLDLAEHLGSDGSRSPDRHSQRSPIPPAERRFEEGIGGTDSSHLERPRKKITAPVRGKAKALYSFTAQNRRELSFKRGDNIYLLRDIDKNWYEGEHHGTIGIFPKNYVEIITSLEDAQAAAFSRDGAARAKYAFKAQTSVELSFDKGDVISVVRHVDENWIEGRLNSKQGILPVSYVEMIAEPDTPMLTPYSSYATTPATASPGPLSPMSTMSNGPAPTIPDAPASDIEDIDYYRGTYNAPVNRHRPRTPTHTLSNPHAYKKEYVPRSASPYDQNRSHSPYRSPRDVSPGKHASSPYRGFESPATRRSYSGPEVSRGTVGGGAGGYDSSPAASRRSYSNPQDARERHTVQDQAYKPYNTTNNDRLYSQAKDARDYYEHVRSPLTVRKAYDNRPSDGGNYGNRNLSSSQPAALNHQARYEQRVPSLTNKYSTSTPEEDKYPLYVALYSYRPQNEDELELTVGDVVSVWEICDDGWYVGTNKRTGHFGTFPGNYVKGNKKP